MLLLPVSVFQEQAPSLESQTGTVMCCFDRFVEQDLGRMVWPAPWSAENLRESEMRRAGQSEEISDAAKVHPTGS